MSDNTTPTEEQLAEAEKLLNRAEPVDFSDTQPSEFLRDLAWLGADGANVHEVVLDLYTKYRGNLTFLMLGRLADILLQQFTDESVTDWISHPPEDEGGPEIASALSIMTIRGLPPILTAGIVRNYLDGLTGETEGDMIHGMAHLFSEEPVVQFTRISDEELADYDQRYAQFQKDHPELAPATDDTTTETEKSA